MRKISLLVLSANSSLWMSRALSNTAAASSKSCAIIGGGVAGLSCANQIADKFDVTVFDTGRIRPGGRSSSRLPGDRPKEDDPSVFDYLPKHCVVDHAAQVLYRPTSENFAPFQKQVKEWEEKGIITRFGKNSLFNIDAGEEGFRVTPVSEEAFYGSKEMGMSSIPNSLMDSSRFTISQDTWVSPSSGAKYIEKSKKWRISASGKVLGHFDHLVIAHNGKCADRLMSKTPARAVHQLLRVNFSPTVAAHGGKRMTLSSIYSFSFALPANSPLSKALPDTFKAAFVKNEKMLRFLACQTNKYPSDESIEVWTLLSSSTFAKKHKAPQEFLPLDTVEEVSGLLLQALERSVGLDSGSLRPIEKRVQLWGAALPLNTWEGKQGFLYDANCQVGVCGDWLTESSIGGAWMSGYLLGNSIRKGMTKDVGLNGRFIRSEQARESGVVGLNN